MNSVASIPSYCEYGWWERRREAGGSEQSKKKWRPQLSDEGNEDKQMLDYMTEIHTHAVLFEGSVCLCGSEFMCVCLTGGSVLSVCNRM